MEQASDGASLTVRLGRSPHGHAIGASSEALRLEVTQRQCGSRWSALRHRDRAGGPEPARSARGHAEPGHGQAADGAEDLARNDAHRRRLQRIVDAVMPTYLMHGHLHRAYQRTCDFGYGPVGVTGLDADNRLRNFAALDVTSMEWDVRPSWFSRFRRGPLAG